MLAAVGDPQDHFAAVHIGGTNGKGSVATMVAEALRAWGLRTGLYTSPHLVDVRERMVVDGRPIPRRAFAAWTEALRPIAEATDASFFEITTAIALADFAARGVEVAVVEVGLGGRLDSTNVLDPLVCAVTSVSRDHTDYLGHDILEIAAEKAGIAKARTPFVVGAPERAVADRLREVARRAGARVSSVPPEELYDGPLGAEGAVQRRNAAVAQHVLEALPPPFRPDEPAIRHGLARARPPGRFERRGRWIFDVAHNPAAVAGLLETIEQAELPRPVHAVVGVLADKDWAAMISMLGRVVDAVWVTNPPSAPAERAWALDRVVEAFGDGVRAVGDFDRALVEAQVGAARVVVTGSFHTVGDALTRLPGFAPLG